MSKIHHVTGSKTEDNLIMYFRKFADKDIREKVHEEFLRKELLKHYRLGNRCSFTRAFWENPDANDPDLKAAFKKRNENNKMELRKV